MNRFWVAPLLCLLAVSCAKDDLSGKAARQAQGLYAEGFNALLEVGEVTEAYISKIPQAGPSEGLKVRLFAEHTRARGTLAKAKAAFDQAAGSAPKTLAHLAPLATATLAGAEQTVSTFAEAHAYYDSEGWKDDQFAKGKTIHARMLQSIETYRTSLDKMSEALTAVEDLQARAELQKYEGKRNASYWFRAALIDAKKFLVLAEQRPGPNSAAKLNAALTQLTAAKEGLASVAIQQGGYKAYQDTFDRLHAAATRLTRVATAGITDPKQAEAFATERSSVVSFYNALVGVHGSLQELEASGLLK